MTSRNWNLLCGAIWRIKQWLEVRQAARRSGDVIAEQNATRRIEVWRRLCAALRSQPSVISGRPL